LPEAEKFYLQAIRKDPNFQGSASADLYKAAMSRLMTGDIPGADALEKQFDDARSAAHDQTVPFRRAEWAWLTGRRKQAYQQLTEFAQHTETGPLKELSSRAYSQLALWSLMLGDTNAASEMVRKAIQTVGPTSAATAALVRFLALPPAPASEWTARAGLIFHDERQASAKDLWLLHAFLLNREFDEAAAAAQRLTEGSADNRDESLPVMQAWALAESGHVDQAADLLRFNPVPPITGPGLFTPFYFPRLYYLRGMVAGKQGKHEEARAAWQLFLKLSGPTPLQWGEELKAK